MHRFSSLWHVSWSQKTFPVPFPPTCATLSAEVGAGVGLGTRTEDFFPGSQNRDSTELVLWAGLCLSTSLLAPEWMITVSLQVGGYPIKCHQPLRGGQHCVCTLEKNQTSASRSPPTLLLPGKGVGFLPVALAIS